MTVSISEVEQIQAQADCLFSEQEVERALDEMARQISRELADRNPLVLCVMNGGLVTTGKLLTRLHFPLQLDYLHATRYRGETSGADLLWKVHPSVVLANRDLLIVDDILDEGETLARVKEQCLQEQARRVWTAVLVDKFHDRKSTGLNRADFTGLVAEDRYLFGYGMDYRGYLRNAAGIFAVSPEN